MLPHVALVETHLYNLKCVFKTSQRNLTSQISLKSYCSTLSNSHVVCVTTVLSLGRSCRMDSPNVAPTPKVHSVTGTWNKEFMNIPFWQRVYGNSAMRGCFLNIQRKSIDTLTTQRENKNLTVLFSSPANYLQFNSSFFILLRLDNTINASPKSRKQNNKCLFVSFVFVL